MDIQTLNNKQHHLRFALPMVSFLKRPEYWRIDDVWSLLHEDMQEWYFMLKWKRKKPTLNTPHGALILSGKDVAEY